MKRFFLLLLLLLLLLVSCTGQEPQSSAGDLQEPGPSSDAAEVPFLQAEYATDEVLAAYPDAHEVADSLSADKYAQKILLTTDANLTDFRFFELEYEEIETGFRFIAGQELYAADQLTPDTPLLVWADFPGVLPTRSLSFADENGATHSYALGQSGKDGSLLLIEEEIAVRLAQGACKGSAIPRELVLSYLSDYFSQPVVYFADAAPASPQEYDLRIDSMEYAGETTIFESIGVAYKVSLSSYSFTRDANSEKVYSWTAPTDTFYLVLRHSGYEETWDGVFGINYSTTSEKAIEAIILETVYGLQDIEVSLSLDGYPSLVGPGSAPTFFSEEVIEEKLEGWGPIYNEGDYWMQYDYAGLTATCYYNGAENVESVQHIETTRPDVMTHRGIRIGASRDQVLAAYPHINHTQYWDYEGAYLWYCANPEGWGAALLFWMENDAVARMELINMFD